MQRLLYTALACLISVSVFGQIDYLCGGGGGYYGEELVDCGGPVCEPCDPCENIYQFGDIDICIPMVFAGFYECYYNKTCKEELDIFKMPGEEIIAYYVSEDYASWGYNEFGDWETIERQLNQEVIKVFSFNQLKNIKVDTLILKKMHTSMVNKTILGFNDKVDTHLDDYKDLVNEYNDLNVEFGTPILISTFEGAEEKKITTLHKDLIDGKVVYNLKIMTSILIQNRLFTIVYNIALDSLTDLEEIIIKSEKTNDDFVWLLYYQSVKD